jgi:predicted DCC family thiol-disulfide oxidoreductase YuxK
MGGDYAISKIVLFDGLCNLCSSSVRFIIKRDSKRKFLFASLQSDYAREILSANSLDDSMRTIVLIKNSRVYLQSDAVLEISLELGGLWPVFYSLKIIPRFIRNSAYRFVSRNRYRWFGKTDACWLPSPDLSSRFI